MNTRKVIKDMLEWIEAQKEPRMIGAIERITAARQWLAAPESEAVLYVATDALEYIAAGGVRIEAVAPCSEIAEDGQFVPLFTRPASKPEPLTLGTIQKLWSAAGHKETLKGRVNAFARAIEAAVHTKGQTSAKWPIDGDIAKRVADKHFVSYEVAQLIAREVLTAVHTKGMK